MMRNAIVVAGITLTAFFALHARAEAQIEFCPASVTMAPLGMPNPSYGKAPPSATYSVVLSAASQRAVWGQLAVETDKGWFFIRFSNVILREDEALYEGEGRTFSRDVYRSPTLYARFPRPVTVRYAFVADGTAKGDAYFNWDQQGAVSCPTGNDDAIVTTGPPAQHLSDLVTLKNPRDVPRAVPAGAPFLTVLVGAVPGNTKCPVPFADATVRNSVVATPPPNARAAEGGAAIVGVAIDASGRLDDAWIWGSSGSSPIDAAALSAARSTTFSPKRAYCENVASIYYMHIAVGAPR